MCQIWALCFGDAVFYFPQGFASDGESLGGAIKVALLVLEKYLHNELSFICKGGATDPYLS